MMTNYQSNNLLRASLTWLDLPSLLFYFSRAKFPPSRTWARNSATLSSAFHSPPGRLWCHDPSTSTANIQKLSHRTTADFSSLHTPLPWLRRGKVPPLNQKFPSNFGRWIPPSRNTKLYVAFLKRNGAVSSHVALNERCYRNPLARFCDSRPLYKPPHPSLHNHLRNSFERERKSHTQRDPCLPSFAAVEVESWNSYFLFFFFCFKLSAVAFLASVSISLSFFVPIPTEK